MSSLRGFSYQITLFSIVIFIVASIGLADANFATGLSQLAEYNATDVVSTHTTYFDRRDINRNNNINLAAEKIDGVMLKAGEVFSFNQVVGPRTKEKGYKKAPEIIAGEFVDGVGGGVSQVSSTLYNAALLANFKIIDRTSHSRPVSYLPLGRSATIYYEQIDLKFKNNSDYPVMIVATVFAEQLTVSLIGRDHGKSIKIETAEFEVLEPEVRKELDKSLAIDEKKVVQEGREGYKVITKRIIKKGNQITKEEVVSVDIYSPLAQIIKYNLKD